MTTVDLLTLIAEELHFEVEITQFTGGGYILRRPSTSPRYRTEYASMRLKGDLVELTGLEKSQIFSLCDPKVFDQLKTVINSSGFLCGSLATMDIPIANRIFPNEEPEE